MRRPDERQKSLNYPVLELALELYASHSSINVTRPKLKCKP